MANFGGSVSLEGESSYRQALRQCTQDLQSMSVALKQQAVEFNAADKSMNSTTADQKKLNDSIKSQQEAVARAKTALGQYNVELQAQKVRHNELTKEYRNAVTELDRIKNASGTTSDEYKKQAQVVDKLGQELAESNVKMDDSKTAISNLKGAINDSNRVIKDAEESVNGLGTETEKSGKQAENAAKGGFTVFKGILADLGARAIVGVMDGFKQLGSGLVDLGKQAVGNYAEFEQLEGGVKKLFGDDYQKVIDNANNGFATAGMNANDYMNTVTSFSASLISGLNGDTSKAAQIADTAIKDMSDNANTFGTDIESLQNAYQGFAKGNFTMLDNLKLGYGGTQSEMARLINESGVLGDSMEVTAQTVKDVPFDQMILAINKTQERMGIMGTTAKEASVTIEGSTNAMKSAWGNMITGIASGSDLTPLIDNFIDSLLTLGNNLIPIVKNVISGLGHLADGLLSKVVPELIEKIPPIINQMLPILISSVKTALQAIIKVLPTIIDAISQLIPEIIGALLEVLPDIVDVGIEAIVSLIDGINKALPKLIKMLPTVIQKTVDVLVKNLPLVIDAGIELIMALIDGIVDALPDLIDKMPEMIDKLINAISKNLPKIIEAGVTLIVKIAEGIIKALPQLLSKVPQVMNSLINGLIAYYGNLFEIGKNLLMKMINGIGSMMGNLASKTSEIISNILDKLKQLPGQVWDIGTNLVKGLWNGISNAKNWVLDKIKGFGKGILDGLKSFFGINSPSTLMRDQVGKFLAEGVGEGFTDEMRSVAKDMQNSIPTDFDVSTNINGKNNFMRNSSYYDLINAFKTALSEMTVEMDDTTMGKFVEKTVARAIYS